MTYGEAYLEGWKNIFNYEGVSNRFEFWSFMIGSGVICLLPLLCWWLAVTINNDYGVFIFCAARVIYFNVDFCRTGDGASRQKDARYRIFRWWVTIVVLIPVTGVILLILCCLPSKSQDQA